MATPTGGISLFTRLCTHLRKHAPEIKSLTLLTEDPAPVAEDVEVIFMKPRVAGIFPALGMPLRNIDYWWYIRKLQQQRPIDVVLFTNTIFGIMTAALLRPELTTVGMVNDSQGVRPAGIKNSAVYHRLRGRMFGMLERLSLMVHDSVLVNSEYLRDVMRKTYGYQGNNLHLLYKSVDVEAIPFRIRPIHPGRRVSVLFVKSDPVGGGMDRLLAALSVVTTVTVSLTIVGPGQDHQKWIRHLNLGGIPLRFTGRLDPRGVSELMQECDLLCVPSYQEALGVANLEALAHGLPVVYVPVDGVPEVMQNGRHGWEATDGTPIAIARAIEDCVSNEEKRTRKSEQGRTYVERHFAKEVMLKRLAELLSGSRSAAVADTLENYHP